MNKINFSTMSMVDNFGRVFFIDKKIYRGINPDKETYCRQLLNSDLFKELERNNYIPKTQISNIKVDGYNLVLEHERLLEIKQHEWSLEMFKSVAIFILNMNKICNKYGYELKDAHTYNIVFRDTQPVYCDLGSIEKRKNINSWTAYFEFVSVFVYPILFYSQNDIYIFRKLVESNFYKMQTQPSQNIFDSSLSSLLKQKPYYYSLNFGKNKIASKKRYNLLTKGIVKFYNKIANFFHMSDKIKFKYIPVYYTEDELKLLIESSGTNIDSTWNKYHMTNYGDKNQICYRFRRIIEIINSLENVSSIIDLAGNEGYFSKLIIKNTSIKRVILTDYDSNVIDTAFSTFKNNNISGISTALLNFIFSPNIGDTAKRFESDVVIALAVTHHLILSQNISIDTIFERLNLFSLKYVLVEFMPLGLWSIHTKSGIIPPNWYTQTWFENKFNQHFYCILSEKIEDNRIIYVGKKKYL